MFWLRGSAISIELHSAQIVTPGVTNQTTFKGNKCNLPSKPCVACGRAMVWRKAWAKNWDSVKYCSEKCRQAVK